MRTINDVTAHRLNCISFASNGTIKHILQNRLPVHRKLCFCFLQRFHPGVELGEQFLNPGNNALLLRERERREGMVKALKAMAVPNAGEKIYETLREIMR